MESFKHAMLVGLALTAVLGAAAPARSAAVDPPATLAPAGEITVLTYNVRGMPWPAARGRGAALKAIGRQLGEMRRQGRQPDVVLIQEGFVGDVAALAKASGYKYWTRGPDRHQRGVEPGSTRAKYYLRGEGWGKLAGSGLHVLSDFPAEKVAEIAYGACAGLDCLANKGAMLVHLDVPGLPNGLDIVNTHLNSRRAARVPIAYSLQAHHRQIDALIDFIDAHHDARVPLLVGGDFNVKNAPDRYDYDQAIRPFKVVSEFCERAVAACGGPSKVMEPWLKSQDLQGFATPEAIAMHPVTTGALFASAGSGGRLSDHDGYLVRYGFGRAAPSSEVAQSNPPTAGLRVAITAALSDAFP